MGITSVDLCGADVAVGVRPAITLASDRRASLTTAKARRVGLLGSGAPLYALACSQR